MNVNDTLAIALLVIAILDTVLAQTVLPKILKQNPATTTETVKMVINTVHITTLLFFAAAVGLYVWKPL